jgi:phosphoglycerate dehydrogenase-like enzyme
MSSVTAAHRVWMPSAEFLDDLPAGVVGDLYDGTGEPPEHADEVEFYVPTYMNGTVPYEIIPTLPKLRVVQALMAGVDAIKPYVPSGVTLCNARGLHNTATAELAVTLTLAAMNDIPGFVRDGISGTWRQRWRQGLADHTVLIVGYGSIGRSVEERLAPFECDVLRVARRPREGVSAIEDVGELLPRADVVIVVVPGTAETRGLVDAAFLARMRDGALLVNVARGPVVDTGALLAEVSSGRLRAALDVTDPEPLPDGHPLWALPNVLITPHVGGASAAMWPRAERLVRDQLRRFVAGEQLANVITGDY